MCQSNMCNMEGAFRMLTSNQIKQFKDQLENRKKQLNDELENNDHFNLEYSYVNESTGELSHYDNHPADTATDLYEREKDIALNEHLEKEIKDINHALSNMEKGQYGKCEVCGKEISVDRLTALPTATTCINHTPDNFISSRRPVEEDILNPMYGRFEYDKKDATLFDSEDAIQRVTQWGTSDTPQDFIQRDMVDYNDMYIESDERVGYVEDIESFIATDIEGKNVTVYPNPTHEEYESMLDEDEVMSVTGNLGGPEIDSIDE